MTSWNKKSKVKLINFKNNIDELERENQELCKSKGLLLSSLSSVNRDSKIIELQKRIDELERENQGLFKRLVNMNSLPLESQISNQLSSSYINRTTGKNQQNYDSEIWEIWLSAFKKEHGNNCFNWLLQIFRINSQFHVNPTQYKQQKEEINALQNAIKNPKTILETFRDIYNHILSLQSRNENLEANNHSLNNNNYTWNQNNNFLRKENQELRNKVYKLEQENQSKVIQLQTRID